MANFEEQHYKMRVLIYILLLALHPTICTAADELGRLFFTPGKRLQLEQDLVHGSSGEEEPSTTLELNGIVQQQHGARTVWINGVPKNSIPGNQPATETVIVPGKSHTIEIKVGEKVLVEPLGTALSTPE
jgi:hypothetical protein